MRRHRHGHRLLLHAVGLAVATVAALTAAPRRARASPPDATHDFVVPTGRLLPGGTLVWKQHELAAWYELHLGLRDDVELSFGMPPGPMLGLAQIRVAVLPTSSPARLTVGAGAGWWLLNDPSTLYGASASVGWGNERVDWHATVMAFNLPQAEARLGVLTAGVGFRMGESVGGMLDVVRFSLLSQDSDGNDFGTTTGLLAGVKIGSREIDVELGALIGFAGVPLIPVVSFTHHD